MLGSRSLISLIARSIRLGTKYGPPQWMSEMWAIVNVPALPSIAVTLGGLREVVDLADLAPEVAHVGRRVERAADDAFEQLLRRELPAVAMDVLAEPLAQRRDVAALEVGVEV